MNYSKGLKAEFQSPTGNKKVTIKSDATIRKYLECKKFQVLNLGGRPIKNNTSLIVKDDDSLLFVDGAYDISVALIINFIEAEEFLKNGDERLLAEFRRQVDLCNLKSNNKKKVTITRINSLHKAIVLIGEAQVLVGSHDDDEEEEMMMILGDVDLALEEAMHNINGALGYNEPDELPELKDK